MGSNVTISDYSRYFPILQRKIYDRQLVYLDSAATTQKPECVIDAVVRAYRTANANVHRSSHYLSNKATAGFEQARQTVARYINAHSEKEIVFTSGATESLNLLAAAFTRRYVRSGDAVLLSEMEHHSNIVPWQQLARERGFRLLYIPITLDAELNMEVYKDLLRREKKIRLLSIIHVSNVTGTVNPLDRLITLAHENGIPVAVDASQSVQHLGIDVSGLDCDFMAFSGHKAYGPTGTGILYGKQKFLDEMSPCKSGGEMVESVSLTKSSFKAAPYKYEAGTPNFVGAIGLEEALRFIVATGIENIRRHEAELTSYAEKHLRKMPGIKVIGNPVHRSGVISFTAEGISDYDLGTLLDKQGVAVRIGSHCAQPFLNKLNLETSIRISFGIYNNREDVEALFEALDTSVTLLRRVK